MLRKQSEEISGEFIFRIKQRRKKLRKLKRVKTEKDSVPNAR